MPVAGALLQRLAHTSIEGRISMGDSAGGGNGEAAANADRLIRETRGRYEGRDVTALLGTTGAGKTVATALIKHTLSARWIPNSRGRWEAQMDSGHDDINRIIRKMQEGYFPSPALKGSYPRLAIVRKKMPLRSPANTRILCQASAYRTQGRSHISRCTHGQATTAATSMHGSAPVLIPAATAVRVKAGAGKPRPSPKNALPFR